MKKSTPTITRRRPSAPAKSFASSTEDLSYIDYKNVRLLRRFMTRYMKVEPRRRTGLTAKQQRMLATAIKRARHLALVPYTLR